MLRATSWRRNAKALQQVDYLMQLTCFRLSIGQTFVRSQDDAAVTFTGQIVLVFHAHYGGNSRMRHRKIVVDAHVDSVADVDHNEAKDDHEQKNENVRQYCRYVNDSVQHFWASRFERFVATENFIVCFAFCFDYFRLLHKY